MTELSTTREPYGTPDRRWLRDLNGLDTTLGVTLDGGTFDALRFPDGAVPAGTVLAQKDVDRLWGPYDPAASDGRQKAVRGRVGHALNAVQVGPGRRVTTAVLDSGGIEARFLPSSPIGGAIGLVDQAVRTALAGRVRYV